MDIETYSKQEPATTKVFFVVEDNLITGVSVGNQVVSLDMRFQFYVVDYVAEQIDKFEMHLDGFTARLRVRKGEVLDVPTDEDKENEIAELQRKLDKLKGDVAE